MKSQLFIPKEVKAGFQKREGTYTKKLAYIIYKDSKGKLRKESSWRSWCTIPGAKNYNSWQKTTTITENDPDVDLTPVDIENVPHDGFVLNKGVQRYGHWGNGRNMIRVYDDRGLEFEITTDNLMFILMTTNCHKRGLEGEFVYAWAGKELLLLPVGCEEYKEATQYTGLQGKKVGRTDMVPGCAYTDKKQRQLIFLGRYNWYKPKNSYYGNNINMSKESVYIDESKKGDSRIVIMKGYTKLATRDTDTEVSNYAELMEEFAKSKYASEPVRITAKKKVIKSNKKSNSSYYQSNRLFGSPFFMEYDTNRYLKININSEREYDMEKREYVDIGYYLYEDRIYTIKEDGNYSTEWHGNRNNDDRKYYTKEELKDLNFNDLFIKLESGREVQIDQY